MPDTKTPARRDRGKPILSTQERRWIRLKRRLPAETAQLECDQCGTKSSEWLTFPVAEGASCPRHYLDDDSCDGIMRVIDADVIKRLKERCERFSLSYSERFERDADLFYRATGCIAPGRSVPLAMGDTNLEERQARWNEWIAEGNAQFHRDLLEAIAALRRLPPPATAPPLQKIHDSLQQVEHDEAADAGELRDAITSARQALGLLLHPIAASLVPSGWQSIDSAPTDRKIQGMTFPLHEVVIMRAICYPNGRLAGWQEQGGKHGFEVYPYAWKELAE